MIGRMPPEIPARMLRACLATADRRRLCRDRHLARRRLHHDGRRAGGPRCTERNVWGFDSFQGLPPPNEAEYPRDRGDHFIDFRNWR